MKLNWSRGFFRAWAVFALAWVCLAGWWWYEYANKAPWLDWTNIQVGDDCWVRFAKWPDGQPFANNFFEIFDDEIDVPSNIELNKKNNAWAADSIRERNKWRAAVRQKLNDCETDAEATLPIVQRFSLKVTRNWPDLKELFFLVLLPPLALFFVGWIFGWIMRGFRLAS
jgi:hypothetical protein